MFVDRFMSTAMHYPCNYGYIPRTLSDDGDPCDVLVLSPMPLITGVVVRCRPIGMLKMDDEAGGDSKILAVPVDKLTEPVPQRARAAKTCPSSGRKQIAHFFEHYKDLEPGKWVRVSTWVGADEAKREILDGVARYEAAQPERDDLSAMTTAAHARRQLAFPLLFVVLWSTGFIAAKYGLAVRAAAHVPSLPLRARRGADGAWSRWRRVRAWPATLAEVGHVVDRGVARPRHLPGRRVRGDRGRHGGRDGRDARRPAADRHGAARPRLARRAGRAAPVARACAGPRRRLARRPAQGRVHRRRATALCRRCWRSPASASARSIRSATARTWICAAARSIQFTACALVYLPLVLAVRARARALDPVRVRARLGRGRAVGGRDQPALLAAAPWRRGERRAACSSSFPPVTAVMAWLLFGETLDALAVAGMALISVGVALARARRRIRLRHDDARSREPIVQELPVRIDSGQR